MAIKPYRYSWTYAWVSEDTPIRERFCPQHPKQQLINSNAAAHKSFCPLCLQERKQRANNMTIYKVECGFVKYHWRRKRSIHKKVKIGVTHPTGVKK